MTYYIKEFEVRWSDIDANRHLVHTAYSAYMAHTRLSFFQDHGIGIDVLTEYGVGPVILNEHIHFIREVSPGESVKVDLELKAKSMDDRFFMFAQCLYKQDGRIAAYSEILISYIDLSARKMVPVPDDWQVMKKAIPRSTDFRVLSKDEIKYENVPYNKVLGQDK